MQSPEIALYWSLMSHTIDQLVAYVDGLSVDDLNWKPLPTANSLAVLAVHTIAATAESVLGTFCGQSISREREAELNTIVTDTTFIPRHWYEIRTHIERAVQDVPSSWLDQDRHHPRRGAMTGREVLLRVVQHAAEHLGHAGLTRDLLGQAVTWRHPSEGTRYVICVGRAVQQGAGNDARRRGCFSSQSDRPYRRPLSHGSSGRVSA